MPQIFWKYENDAGNDYEISIYHGDVSGHVLLYSGQEIIKIDFNVFSDKVYSFMLGNELFELRIKIQQRSIKYQLINCDQNILIRPIDGKCYPIYMIVKTFVFIICVIILICFLYRLLLPV